MTLKLGYDFTAEPNPIRASAKGRNATANVVDIQVLISNPSTEPVKLTKLTIEIPVGEDTPRALSSAPSLPAPVYDRDNLAWEIASAASTVTITPRSGNDGTVGIAPLIFHLNEIEVSTEPGIVPITISEFRPATPKTIDSQSYHLLKQPADLPVTRFWAEPAELYDVDQRVTLKWDTTDAGDGYSYQLHSEDWQPKDCLDGGECFTRQDGNGVQTPALAQTTTFALDVIKADATGHRTIRWTVHAKVRVKVPKISENSRSDVYNGGLARLHWVARNATRCSIVLDRRILTDQAPVDTYHDGYTVVVPVTGHYDLSVTAHGSGNAQATHTFANPPTVASVIVPLGAMPRQMAVSPDGTLAVVACADRIAFVDLVQGTSFDPMPVAMGQVVAITPDGTLALASDGDTILFIDIASRRAGPNPVTVPGFNSHFYRSIAITPDGKLALVPSAQGISVIDIAGRRIDPNPVASNAYFKDDSVQTIAITPNGKFALLGYYQQFGPGMIDLARRELVARDVRMGTFARQISFTPDSKLAFIGDASNLYLFDIEKGQWDSLNPLVPNAGYVALSRDGAWGFASIGSGYGHDQYGNLVIRSIFSVAIIDIKARRILPDQVKMPGQFEQIAMGRDRLLLLSSDGSLCLL